VWRLSEDVRAGTLSADDFTRSEPTPKWAVRRYRFHEVTERMGAPVVIDWAVLVVELGYADPSHLVRGFTRMFGEPPTAYAARCAGRRPAAGLTPIG